MPSRRKKHRGSRTHGRGNKAGRGAGKRGGRGNAGLHKHKFMSTLKYDPDRFGRRGFKRPQKVVTSTETINLRQLDEQMDNLIEQGVAYNEEDTVVVDLSEIGVDKLLGRGRIGNPTKVKVTDCSESARRKIESAGGAILEPE